VISGINCVGRIRQHEAIGEVRHIAFQSLLGFS
jgi:hypothetical protein